MSAILLRFAENHPCGTGHFPGNPIIPGALLLDETLGAIGEQLRIGDELWQIKSAKFLLPVRPGAEVQIDYIQMHGGEIGFECSVSGNKVLSGVASHQHLTK